MLDSVIRANKKYYPQTLLTECKYVQEKKKTDNLIYEDFEKSESDSDFNYETESGIDNDEYDEQFVESNKSNFNSNKSLRPLEWFCLIVCVNHTLLSNASLKDVGFYLRQSF